MFVDALANRHLPTDTAARELHLHHVVFRENGGATSPDYLLTACASCHGRIHAGLLVVRGMAPDGIEMTGRNGEPLRRRAGVAEPVLDILRSSQGDDGERRTSAADIRRGEASTPLDPTSLGQSPLPQTLSLDDIPAVVDAGWWARHEHLLE